jgi:ATP-dependent Clp protease ATP-binding subunit ClpC
MGTPENLTARARRVLSHAHSEAYRYRRYVLGTEHVLLGLIHDTDDAVTRTLAAVGLSPHAIRRGIERICGPAQPPRPFHLPFSTSVRDALDTASNATTLSGHSLIDAEHILYGLASTPNCTAVEVFTSLGVTPAHLVRQLERQWDTSI